MWMPLSQLCLSKDYQDLQMVFSKDKTLSLPHHQLYDCTISLLCGVPLPTSCLYNLSAICILVVGEGFFFMAKTEVSETMYLLPEPRCNNFFLSQRLTRWYALQRSSLVTMVSPCRGSKAELINVNEYLFVSYCTLFDGDERPRLVRNMHTGCLLKASL